MMDSSMLIVLLPLATFALLIAFARWNKARTEDRLENDTAPKSTLAADAPNSR